MADNKTNRRKFLKDAAILSGVAGLTNVLPSSITKAMAIQADPGTSYLDAEHIVFLMQENRSFDHMFGAMRGVRGFRDPRVKHLPDGDTVWIQKDKDGNALAPFHIDINKTKVTWQGGLPHTWPDQTAARNNGFYNGWIDAKSSMCMGYYDRSDVPFYYALADAFTLCDHYFCSSLTGTTPNRLYFWTGNIRPDLSGNANAAVYNAMAESRKNKFVDWAAFPELLEENGISWKVYQNELWTPDLPKEDIDYWLGNYGCNALEYVTRYHVELSAYFRKHGNHTINPPLSAKEVQARYDALSDREKNLIDKAFTTNIDDGDDYLKLAPFTFTNDQGEQVTMQLPGNDIFKRFREDVQNNRLPMVSWLSAPKAFSDHTSTPLYGTWYVSEVLDILTKNPDVWKKTIFILNYDENDGYFDHFPPFVPPFPRTPDSGKVSAGIDVVADYEPNANAPIGLGYRVPMIVASPWSKGGYVNSQVFDHTSTLLFLEKFLRQKTGKTIVSDNISSWRRAVCGDLTSVFRPYNGEQFALPAFLKRERVITDIQNAKNKPRQAVPEPLSREEINRINLGFGLHQEPGTKPACALPYQLFAECTLDEKQETLHLRLEAGVVPGAGHLSPAGAAFGVYTPGIYNSVRGYNRSYATTANGVVTDEFFLNGFKDKQYHICIHGPNGFFRQFQGSENDPVLTVHCYYETAGLLKKKNTGNLRLLLRNGSRTPQQVVITDNAYKSGSVLRLLPVGERTEVIIDLSRSSGWYDFSVTVTGYPDFVKQYAGHTETGTESVSDPYMGGVV